MRQKNRELILKMAVAAVVGLFLLDRIVINPEIRFGKPCVRGTRITVGDVHRLRSLVS